MKKVANNKDMIRELKKSNQEYLSAVEKFLDIADNIQDDDLKKRVIFQMLRCDECLTKISEVALNKNK